jgi:hypothetical protein
MRERVSNRQDRKSPHKIETITYRGAEQTLSRQDEQQARLEKTGRLRIEIPLPLSGRRNFLLFFFRRKFAQAACVTGSAGSIRHTAWPHRLQKPGKMRRSRLPPEKGDRPAHCRTAEPPVLETLGREKERAAAKPRRTSDSIVPVSSGPVNRPSGCDPGGRLPRLACHSAGNEGDKKVQRNRFFRTLSAVSDSLRSSRSRLWRRAGLFVATLAAGLLFCGAPVRSLGSTPTQPAHIYLYDSGGSPVDVTTACYYVGSQAYIYTDNPIAVTLDYEEGHVYDFYGNVIGYITQSGAPLTSDN